MARGSTSRSSAGPAENDAVLQAMQRMLEARQEHNRLMQERMDRQENVGHPAIGAPPPPLRGGTVADFRRLHPDIFASTEPPLQAKQWLVKTEQLLKDARVPELDKVDVVSIQLTDLTHIWWTNEIERLDVSAT